MEHVKYLIIGGGLSGLSAALALGSDALILEKDAEAGGYCRSFRKDGFVWDCAGHFFHFQDDTCRRFFLSLFEPGELLEREKECAIYYHGALVGYPFQSHIHELSKEELIDCLYDLFHRPEAEERGGFLSLLYARYGAAITDKFLRPYNEKLYACDLRQLDPSAMGRFFPRIEARDIIDSMKQSVGNTYNSSYLYPKNGCGALIERLVKRLQPGTLLTERALCRLDPEARIAEDSRGDRYHYEIMINTMPLSRFLKLLGISSEGASWNKVLVLNLGFEKKAPLTAPHWLYVPGPEARFYRLGFYDNVLDGDRASLYAEIGFPAHARVDAEAELSAALESLRALGLIQSDNRLLAHHALLMDPAYVHIGPQTEKQIQRWKEDLAGMDIYSIGRYGSWRYCSMEDCMIEAAALAKQLEKERNSA